MSEAKLSSAGTGPIESALRAGLRDVEAEGRLGILAAVVGLDETRLRDIMNEKVVMTRAERLILDMAADHEG